MLQLMFVSYVVADQVGRTAARAESPRFGHPLALIILSLTAMVGCSALQGAGLSATPAPPIPTSSVPSPSVAATSEASPGGIALETAIASARQHLVDPSSDVTATMAGEYLDVFASLANRPDYGGDQPDPEFPDGTSWVWGIQFASDVEVCGPPGGKGCEHRSGLVTVFLDYFTGEWLRTTTYAP